MVSFIAIELSMLGSRVVKSYLNLTNLCVGKKLPTKISVRVIDFTSRQKDPTVRGTIRSCYVTLIHHALCVANLTGRTDK